MAVQVALWWAEMGGESAWGVSRSPSDGSLCVWVLLTDNFSMDLTDGSVATVIVSGHQAPAIYPCVCGPKVGGKRR